MAENNAARALITLTAPPVQNAPVQPATDLVANPYHVYVSQTSYLIDGGLTQFPFQPITYLYITEQLRMNILLGTFQNPIQITRVHIPANQNVYPLPMGYDQNEQW
jgi:hypothetical protein